MNHNPSALTGSANAGAPNIRNLLAALEQSQHDDALANPFSNEQWSMVAPYLQTQTLVSGQVLFVQGSAENGVHVVESGTLSVHFQDAKERLRLTVLGPGSLVGEGGFFSRQPRRATVQAVADCRIWTLSALRFNEFSKRHPALALMWTLALGEVMALRLTDSRRRNGVT